MRYESTNNTYSEDSNNYVSNSKGKSSGNLTFPKIMMQGICDDARKIIFDVDRVGYKYIELKYLDCDKFKKIIDDISTVGLSYPTDLEYGGTVFIKKITKDRTVMYDYDFTAFATECYDEFIERLPLIKKDGFILYSFLIYDGTYYSLFRKKING